MSIARARKEAAKRLGIELDKRHTRLANAGADKTEVTIAAVDLGELFNDNIHFIIWVLKVFGGLEPPSPEPIKRILLPGEMN